MRPYYADDFVTIHHGDSWQLAPTLPPQSVHTIVTSPPYWGLRDYGEPGQFGLESTPDEYVARLVALFALLRPALRDDGTVWLNLGDSYSRDVAKGGSGPNGKHDSIPDYGAARRHMSESRGSSDGAVGRGDRAPIRNGGGLPQKNLIGIPWRVAFALQADGWYLRQDIIWHKPNPMPESVTDRCTKAHEYIFLLSKSPRYYYDHEAIKEPAICGDPRKPYAPGQVDARGDGHDRKGGTIRPSVARGGFDGKNHEPGKEAFRSVQDWRNKRSVWTVATQPFAAAHFAVFPPALITPCILAGCPEGGTVCDPFMGSGTTAQVARSLGRKSVGFELNAEYIEIAANKRLAQGVLL